MKKHTKSKLILCIIIVILTLTGVIGNKFNEKYVDDNQDSKSDNRINPREVSGDWDPQVVKSVGNSPRSIFIGDANNDGYNDIVTANDGSDDVSILLWNSTLGDWDPQITRSIGDIPVSLFIGDANNDGYNDIATTDANSDDVSIFLWNSTLEDWDPQIIRSVGDYPMGLFIGDANNDGYNDVATANPNSGDVSILLWNSTLEDWDPQITQSIVDIPVVLFIGDANNDGYNDIATANIGSWDVSILLWNSTLEDWDPQITKSVGDWPSSVFIGDANNDGYNDIATTNEESDDVSILLWNSTLEDWDPQIRRSVGNLPAGLFIGDANNDGYNDIATANAGPDDVSILLWNTTLEDWDPQITKSVGNDPNSVFIGDANNDGYNDIATANYGSDDVSILLWKSPYITIVSPENKTYGLLKGYYPATYGFDNDEEGGDPAGWIVDESGGTVKILRDLDGHKKVLELNDLNETDTVLIDHDTIQTYGTWEFWYQTNNTSQRSDFILYSGGSPLYFIWFIHEDNKWIYNNDGTWEDVPIVATLENDTWHHVRVDFRCNGETTPWQDLNQNKWQLIVDGISSGELSPRTTKVSVTRLRLSTTGPTVNFSAFFDAIGYSWDPAYELGDNLDEGMRLNYYNNTRLDWIKYSLDDQDNRTIFEQEIIPLPEHGPHTIQVFGRDSESGEILESEIIYFSVDIEGPEIIIHSPVDGEAFGCMAPKYNISFIDANFDSMWYTIDDGITNFSTSKLSGFIDQQAWCDAPSGPIIIRFYAKDVFNNTNYEEVVITKTKLLSIDIINQSFSLSEFRIEFSVYNESDEAIDFVTMQMWWDGIDVSSDVQNLGNGLYSVSLEPIIIAPGEDPILLNMTISATGYADKYFETLIAVYPSDLVEDTLELEIVDQLFSTEEFNITFFIHNITGASIDFATFQMWWNGVDVSSDLQNLGNGYYLISLVPITVAPGEDPILLNMTISATGYEDKYFEKYFAVPPCDLIEDILELAIVDQSFSTEQFNITFFIHNITGAGIDFATFQIWWNGVDISADILNLGNGYYFISLESITVDPGEDPILLSMTISAIGYDEIYFELDIVVDPASLLKGGGEPPTEFPLALVIIISAISAGVIIVLISIYWLRRRKREPQ